MRRELLARILEEHEGVRLKPYKDTVGKITIGVGRNLDDVGLDHREVTFLLDNDIDRVIGDLDLRLGWWRQLDQVRQLVIADMCFNLGITGLLGFKKTLRAISDGRYEDGARMMLQSKWAKQVGRRARRLAEMMRTGEMKSL